MVTFYRTMSAQSDHQEIQRNVHWLTHYDIQPTLHFKQFSLDIRGMWVDSSATCECLLYLL